jgi:hypothetical protein
VWIILSNDGCNAYDVKNKEEKKERKGIDMNGKFI